MADRVPLPNVAGLLSGFVAVDLPAGYFSGETRLIAFEPAVTDPPSSGSVTVELRTATGGGGSGLAATIPDGARLPAAPVTGNVTIPAGTQLYLRITGATGGPLGLYGQYQVESAAGASAALTTLSLVKQYLAITDTSTDTILNWMIAGVSEQMQQWIGRRIVSQSVTGEKYSAQGIWEVLRLRRQPVVASGMAITVNGTALGAGEFDVDEDIGHVYRTPGGAGTTPAPWPEGTRHILVDYTSGYSAIPADLEKAATVQVAWDFKRSGHAGGRLGERSTVIGEGTATYLVDAWAPDVLPVLQSYRQPCL